MSVVQNHPKVFVAMPSLDDSELITSVINALDDAQYKDRVHIGIAYATQFSNKKLNAKIQNSLGRINNVSIKFINLNKFFGSVWGRINARSLYSGEDYYLQIDAHTLFDTDWDSRLIEIFEQAKTKVKNKLVISGSPSAYRYNINGQRKNIDNKWKLTCPYYVNGTLADRFNEYSQYTMMFPNWSEDFPETVWSSFDDIFFPSAKVSGGMIFGDKGFAEDYLDLYPYPAVFYEEEIMKSVELVNKGYEIVCTSVPIPISHLYSMDINDLGGKREFSKTPPEKTGAYIDKYKEYILSNKIKIDKYLEKTGMNLRTNTIEFPMPEPDWFKNDK